MAVLCRLGHNECNEYSVYLLDEWMSLPNHDEENPIPVSTIMCKANIREMYMFSTIRSWVRIYLSLGTDCGLTDC